MKLYLRRMTGWQSAQITIGVVFGAPLLGYAIWAEHGIALIFGLLLCGLAAVTLKEVSG